MFGLIGSLHENPDIPAHDRDYYARRNVMTATNVNGSNRYATNFPPGITQQESFNHFSGAHPGMSGHGVTISDIGMLNSPKRLSLDERLEKELGIKVSV